ncbi:MAG: hypothetical protein HRT36_07095 [Alphaproteobacteria bacterium]|nr:hypothetical protein [Alphaproteobacteria bacterium]
MKSLIHGGSLGQRCQHPRFGEGTITTLKSQYYVIESDGHCQKKVSVDFITLLDQ